jgi:hypothetical protein
MQEWVMTSVSRISAVRLVCKFRTFSFSILNTALQSEDGTLLCSKLGDLIEPYLPSCKVTRWVMVGCFCSSRIQWHLSISFWIIICVWSAAGTFPALILTKSWHRALSLRDVSNLRWVSLWWFWLSLQNSVYCFDWHGIHKLFPASSVCVFKYYLEYHLFSESLNLFLTIF